MPPISRGLQPGTHFLILARQEEGLFLLLPSPKMLAGTGGSSLEVPRGGANTHFPPCANQASIVIAGSQKEAGDGLSLEGTLRDPVNLKCAK